MTLKQLVVVGVAVAALAAGAAYAAIPSGNGTISACVKQNGELKLMDVEAGETCTGSNKKVVTWNQQGPAGPQGTPGANGAQGPPGPAASIGFASINADGSLGSATSGQRSVVGTTRTSAGHYLITYDQTIALCRRWTSTTAGPRMFTVGHLPNNTTLAVVAYDPTGAAVDSNFTLYVSC